MKKIIILLLLIPLSISLFAQDNKGRADNLYNLAVNRYMNGGDIKDVSKIFEQVETLQPDYPRLYYIWGFYLLDSADKQGSDSLRLEGITKMDKSIEFSPEDADAYFMRGLELVRYADKVNNDSIYEEGINTFQKGLTVNPNHAGIYCHWGDALFQKANESRDKNLMQEAISLFHKADNVVGKKYMLNYILWANSLAVFARIDDDEKIYKESIDLYKKSISTYPNLLLSYSSCAFTLTFLAKKTKDITYCKEAIELYDRSERLGNDIVLVSEGKAYTYFILGKLEKKIQNYGIEITSLYSKTEEMGSQSAAYNLACYYSIIKDKETALQWFEKMLTHDYKIKTTIDKKKIDEDKDFNNIRKNKRFKELMKIHFN